jgi:GNAT superfamily N-acetyltransferase
MTAHNATEISMVRYTLDHLPEHSLPAPFALRGWRAGDLDVWLGIQQQADTLQSVTASVFRFFYGNDETAFARRILFLCDAAGRAVGTASAWHADTQYGPAFARVHWVAIIPDMQRKGLSRPLMAAVLHRMRELGHTKAYLTTESARVIAIKLYRSLGFVPEIKNDDDRRTWADIN